MEVPVNVELTEKLQKLKEQSDDLNKNTDELNNQFLMLEKHLYNMRLGVSGWAKTLIVANDKNDTVYKFGFCKMGSAWKLVCRSVLVTDELPTDDDDKRYGLLVPIVLLPRHIRIQASQIIEEVVDDLLAKTKDFADTVDASINRLHEFDSELNKDDN